MFNKDFKDILQNLSTNNVKYLLVGAYAMGVHGYPRATGDIDIWVEPTLENSQNLYLALKEFGAPLENIQPNTFTQTNIVFQIGIAPCRIDILTHIDGISFEKAYKNHAIIPFDELSIPTLSKEDLITNKKSTGRPKDKVDVQYLKETPDSDQSWT